MPTRFSFFKNISFIRATDRDKNIMYTNRKYHIIRGEFLSCDQIVPCDILWSLCSLWYSVIIIFYSVCNPGYGKLYTEIITVLYQTGLLPSLWFSMFVLLLCLLPGAPMVPIDLFMYGTSQTSDGVLPYIRHHMQFQIVWLHVREHLYTYIGWKL